MTESPVSILPTGYQRLFERAVEVLQADARVRALWLAGSFGRGDADAASDLDIIVTVSDIEHEAFTSSSDEWLAAITPTVIAHEIPFIPGSLYTVTPGFERFDVVVESVTDLVTTMFRDRTLVFDKDCIEATLPPHHEMPGPSVDAVLYLIVEYFRTSAIETITVRGDWLLARQHIHHVSSLVHRLFVESNQPLPMMGVKQWSSRLNEAQQTVLSGLPTNATDLESLREAHLSLAAAFVTNAEALLAHLGGEWPTELETATAAHLQRHLDLPTPHPRTGEVVVQFSN